jgi:hypothetical protein
LLYIYDSQDNLKHSKTISVQHAHSSVKTIDIIFNA